MGKASQGTQRTEIDGEDVEPIDLDDDTEIDTDEEAEDEEAEEGEEAEEAEEAEDAEDAEEAEEAEDAKPDRKDKEIAKLRAKLEKARIGGVNAALAKLGVAEKFHKYAHTDLPTVNADTKAGKKALEKWAKGFPEMRGKRAPDVKAPKPLIKGLEKKPGGVFYNEAAHRKSISKLERNSGRR